MSYSFEYIDIILLAMIAGFIFLRLRGILGKRTEENLCLQNYLFTQIYLFSQYYLFLAKNIVHKNVPPDS